MMVHGLFRRSRTLALLKQRRKPSSENWVRYWGSIECKKRRLSCKFSSQDKRRASERRSLGWKDYFSTQEQVSDLRRKLHNVLKTLIGHDNTT